MKKTSINVFNTDPSVDNIAVVYFLSNIEGKKIQIQALREDTELCTSNDDHSIITVTSIPVCAIQKLPILNTPDLKLVFMEIHNYIYFILLPLLSSTNKNYYSEKLCSFESCKTPPKQVRIIIYPDLVYSASITVTSTGKIDGASLSVTYGKSKPIKVDLDTFNKIVDFLTWFSDIETNLANLFNKKILHPKEGPFTFDVDPPKIDFNCNWRYITNKDHTKIGGLYHFDISLTPLFGGSITVHILEFVISLAANAVLPAGGQAIVNCISNFVDILRNYINGRFNLDLDVYIDLIIEGNLNLSLVTDIDTTTTTDNIINFPANLEVNGTLTAGVNVAAKVFMINASGTTGINLLGGVAWKFITKDVSFYSKLTFEGLKVKVVIEIDVKLFTLSYKPNWTFADETVIWSGEYNISKDSSKDNSSAGGSYTYKADGGVINNIANF